MFMQSLCASLCNFTEKVQSWQEMEKGAESFEAAV